MKLNIARYADSHMENTCYIQRIIHILLVITLESMNYVIGAI